MGELSIKINIAGRIYPLTIKSEEEEGVRKAARRINDRLKQFEQDYAVKDKQDLLAMCALEFANLNHTAKDGDDGDSKLLETVRAMNEMAASVLAR